MGLTYVGIGTCMITKWVTCLQTRSSPESNYPFSCLLVFFIHLQVIQTTELFGVQLFTYLFKVNEERNQPIQWTLTFFKMACFTDVSCTDEVKETNCII